LLCLGNLLNNCWIRWVVYQLELRLKTVNQGFFVRIRENYSLAGQSSFMLLPSQAVCSVIGGQAQLVAVMGIMTTGGTAGSDGSVLL
jgi:hypothetical protein